MINEAANRLREEPDMLFRMPGIGTQSGLDRWSNAVASGRVPPTGDDALWGRVEQMFAEEHSRVADALTGTVLVPGLGRHVPVQQFGAGITDHRRGRAAPFDASLFTHAATTAGRSAVAIDETPVARLGLVLRSGRTDVAQIRAMLPGSVAEHAEDMARLLAELETQSGRAGEPGGAASRHRAGIEEARVDAGADSERLFRPARPAEPAPRDTDEIQYRAGDFAAFAFGEQRGEVHTICLRRRQRGGERPGALELTWPPYPPPDGRAETVVIYRVVSEEDNPPYSPDRAHMVAATTGTSATDERPPEAAVRHYQVWVNTGPTPGQA